VVRNGRLPARQIQTGLGLVEVQQPRVNDRRINEKGERMRFSSAILPPYLRRTQSVEELIPWLYLRGISTGGGSPRPSRPCWDRRPRACRPPTSCV
jgi:hypothetical protein